MRRTANTTRPAQLDLFKDFFGKQSRTMAHGLGPTFEEFIAACGKNVIKGQRSTGGLLKRSESKLPTHMESRRVGRRELSMMSWSVGGIYAGEVPVECFRRRKPRIADILEPETGSEYRLSPRACQGVLNRDVGRGRPLPDKLKAILMAQAAG